MFGHSRVGGDDGAYGEFFSENGVDNRWIGTDRLDTMKEL